MRKLQLIPEHTPISLALPSELRRSSAFRHVFRHPWSADIRTRIADRSEARRMAQQGRVARRLEAMADCLDLRAMASFSADGYTTAMPNPHMYVCADGYVNGIALPEDEVLAGKFDPHARALCVASSEQLIGKRWRGACSTELDGAQDGRLHVAQVVRMLPELPLPLPALRAQGRARSDH
jgi:hypothetical protein